MTLAATLVAGSATGCGADAWPGVTRCYEVQAGNGSTERALGKIVSRLTGIPGAYNSPDTAGLHDTLDDVRDKLQSDYKDLHGQDKPRLFVPNSGDYYAFRFDPEDETNDKAGGTFTMYEPGTVTQLDYKQIDKRTRAYLQNHDVNFVQIACDGTTKLAKK